MSDEQAVSVAPPSRVGNVEFEFVEELPKFKRAGGGTLVPRQAFPWGRALEPVRKEKGKWAKILTYGEGEKAANSARTKASAINKALISTHPHEHWEIRARERDDVWGVYARFVKVLDEAQQAERAKLRQERATRIRTARGS